MYSVPGSVVNLDFVKTEIILHEKNLILINHLIIH